MTLLISILSSHQLVDYTSDVLSQLFGCDVQMYTVLNSMRGPFLERYPFHFTWVGRGRSRWDEWVCTPFPSLHGWDVQPDRVTYPSKEVVGNDAIPLIQKLKYDDRLLPAMQQVFGKAMVCRDMECASRVSRQVSDARLAPPFYTPPS